jgi:heptosyltransferase-1
MKPQMLIVRLGAMGDVLHALPAVAMLRSAIPAAHIGWVIERRWRELLCAPDTELCGPRQPGRPLVEQVHLVDTRAWRKHPLRREIRNDFRESLRTLHDRRYDSAIDFQGAIKSATLARLSGAEFILGFEQPRESFARRFYHATAGAHAAHVIAQNLELAQSWLRKLGYPAVAYEELPAGTALLPTHPASEARVAELLHTLGLGSSHFAILNPGAGWGAKQWPTAHYASLAIELASRGLPTLINYGPGEEHLAGEVAAASHGHAISLSTTISELIALCRRARLFVAGDTGPMHLAALLGVPTVALFGPTDPARNGPYYPCARLLRHQASATSYSHKRTHDAGLDQLSVADVLATIDLLLS